MQNKHQKKILVVGVPTFGEGGGGVKPVWIKSQVYPKKSLDGSPKVLTTHRSGTVQSAPDGGWTCCSDECTHPQRGAGVNFPTGINLGQCSRPHMKQVHWSRRPWLGLIPVVTTMGLPAARLAISAGRNACPHHPTAFAFPNQW